MRKSPVSAPVLVAAFAFGLSACGGGSDDQTAQAAEPVAETPHTNAHLPLPEPTGEREVGARVYEYSIDLTRDSLSAGPYDIHVVNAGTTPHMLIVRNDASYFATQHLVPGDSAVLHVDLPPGDYHIVCAVRDEFDHISEGERRDLIVR